MIQTQVASIWEYDFINISKAVHFYNSFQETRETRINQYHEESDKVVIGLREGTFLNVTGNVMKLGGKFPARIFAR